jgi:beta-galactosidase
VAVTVSVVDDAAQQVPIADNLVEFQIAGPARILGVGNGDPKSHEPDRAPQRALFSGLAQLIVQATREPGEITITATAAGLQPATLTLQSIPPKHSQPIVAPARRRHLLTDWRVSPPSPMRPDPNQLIAAADMNSWERISLAAGSSHSPAAGYVVYRTTFTPPKSLQSTGGRIIIATAPAGTEIYVNEIRTAGPTNAVGAIAAPFPASAEKLTLSILIYNQSGSARFIAPVELKD